MIGMATLAVLAWHPSDPADRDTLERHNGSIGRRPGIAYFPGAADALRAATHWQRRDHPHPLRAIAVTVAELDPNDPDGSAAVRMTHRLAETGQPGTIVATEIVRLLIPEPDCGSWAAAAPPAEPTTAPTHELLWRETPAPLRVVAEDAAIIRAGIVSLLRADGMDILGEAADFDTLLATVRRTRPQLLITDIRMPPGQGDEGLRAAEILRAEQPHLSVLSACFTTAAGSYGPRAAGPHPLRDTIRPAGDGTGRSARTFAGNLIWHCGRSIIRSAASRAARIGRNRWARIVSGSDA